MLSTVIKTDGSYTAVKPSNGESFSYEELTGFVGGYIEVVYLSNSQVMIVNEEGKLNSLPINADATLIARMVGIDDVIVGNVLVCDSNKIK